MQPRLSLSGVKKSFGPIAVLHGVALTVQPGEVHGLLGENGAGKSTLLNILSGVFSLSEGSVSIDGTPVHITSPRSASAAGIAMIHQELQQVPELSVAQNIFPWRCPAPCRWPAGRPRRATGRGAPPFGTA